MLVCWTTRVSADVYLVVFDLMYRFYHFNQLTSVDTLRRRFCDLRRQIQQATQKFRVRLFEMSISQTSVRFLQHSLSCRQT